MSKHRITAHPIIDIPFGLPDSCLVPTLVLPNGKFLYEAWKYITSPAKRGLAYSTRRKQMEAISLFADYFHFRYGDRSLTEEEADSLLENFIGAYLNGTIQNDGTCPYGLYWKVKSSTWPSASSILQYVTGYLDYCANEFGFTQLNPLKETQQSQFRALCRRSHLKTHSMFNYLKDREKDSDSILDHRKVQIPRNILNTKTLQIARAFPCELVKPFFSQGLQQSSKHLSPRQRPFSIRDQLYFMLLLFQGVRKSEPLHLFVDDIRPIRDGNTLKAQIRYYHPVIGQMRYQSRLPSKDKKMVEAGKLLATTRAEYLKDQYGRVPRNKMSGMEYAGWKGISLEKGSPEYYAEGYWILEEYSQIFLKLHSIYINEIRPNHVDHPYYFVCLDRDNYGKPLTISAVNEIFERSCHRTGITPTRDTGVNIHGLRHRYGQTAVNLSLSPAVIQRMLHQASIHSQAVYASPSPSLVNKILTTAQAHSQPFQSETEGQASLKTALSLWKEFGSIESSPSFINADRGSAL